VTVCGTGDATSWRWMNRELVAGCHRDERADWRQTHELRNLALQREAQTNASPAHSTHPPPIPGPRNPRAPEPAAKAAAESPAGRRPAGRRAPAPQGRLSPAAGPNAGPLTSPHCVRLDYSSRPHSPAALRRANADPHSPGGPTPPQAPLRRTLGPGLSVKGGPGVTAIPNSRIEFCCILRLLGVGLRTPSATATNFGALACEVECSLICEGIGGGFSDQIGERRVRQKSLA